MSEVICISSSDDEESVSKTKKNVTKTLESTKFKAQKRKTSISLVDGVESKKSKNNENNTKFKNNELFNMFNSSKSNLNKKNKIDKDLLQEPQSSKQTSEVEKQVLSVNNIKKPVNVSFCMPSTSKQSTTIRKVIKPKLIVKEKVPIPDPLENVFENFLQICKEKKDDEVTIKILENLKRRYNKLNQIDRDSEELRLFLSGSLQKLLNNTDKFYSCIQEVQDEVKRRIKIPKLATPEKQESKAPNKKFEQRDEVELEIIQEEKIEQEEKLSEETMKRVRKLEKAIVECKKRIKELETQEVNFDDEEDSCYLQEDRYKRKLIELCNKLAEIMGDKMLKREIYKRQLRRSDISEELTGIPSVDNTIINFINSGIKKVNNLKHIKNPTAIADFLRVPDYPDIIQCISKCNDERDLGLTRRKMEQLARVAFRTVGRFLKKKRIKESQDYLSSLDATLEEDPAMNNKQLYEKLQKNKKEGDQKLNEIFKKFVDKQEGLSQEDLEKEVKTSSESENGTEEEISEIHKKHKAKTFKKIIYVSESEEETDDRQVISLIKSKEKEHNDEKDKKDTEIIKDQFQSIEKNVEKEKNEFENTANNQKVEENILKKHIEIKKVKVIINKLESNEKLDRLMLNEKKENNESNKDKIRSTESNINSIKSVSKNSDVDILSANTNDEIKIVNDDNENSESVTLAKKNFNTETEHGYASLVSDSVCTSNENIVKTVSQSSSKNDPIEDLPDNDIIVSSILTKNNTDNSIKNIEAVDSASKNNSISSNINNNTDQSKIDSNKNDSIDVKNCISTEPTEIQNNIETETPSKNNECSKDSLSIPQIENSEIITIDNSAPSSVSNTEEDLNVKKCSESMSTITDTNAFSESLEIIEIIDGSKESSTDKICKEIDKDCQVTDEKLSNKGRENKTVFEETLPFIKVCSFAKPPDSWKDSSPEKPKQQTQAPKQVVLKPISKPVFVDLTLPSTSKQLINPLAIKRVIPFNKMVVKKVINNANQIPRTGQPHIITIPKSNFNQRQNVVSPNNIRTAYKIALHRPEKSSN